MHSGPATSPVAALGHERERRARAESNSPAPAKREILRDRHGGHQREMLMHHSNPALDRVGG